MLRLDVGWSICSRVVWVHQGILLDILQTSSNMLVVFFVKGLLGKKKVWTLNICLDMVHVIKARIFFKSSLI